MKQPPALATMSKLLDEFADDCDGVTQKCIFLPRSEYGTSWLWALLMSPMHDE